MNFQYLDRHSSIKEDEEVEQRGGVWSDGDDGSAFGKDLIKSKAFDYKGG